MECQKLISSGDGACGNLAIDFSTNTSHILDEDFVKGAPVFAAEVRSKHDYGDEAERKIAEKIADYFKAGTLVVWDVDLLREHVVRVYRASDPQNPATYRKGEHAEAEPAVPGWRMPVDDLFA
jgi:Uma2 family endonuclease